MLWFDKLLALSIVLFIGGVALRSFARFQAAAQANVGNSALLGSRVRSWYVSYLDPFEHRCSSLGVSPAHLSFAQLLLSVVVSLFFAVGMLFTGGWLLLVTGTLDILDGRLARRTASASSRGAFLDSVIDRYADSLAFMGLAAYYRESFLLWVAMFALVGSLLTSYTRARAEGLGQSCRVGLLQRPERYVLLGFGAMASVVLARLLVPIVPLEDGTLLGLVLIVLSVLVNFTAIQRAVFVWRRLSDNGERHVA